MISKLLLGAQYLPIINILKWVITLNSCHSPWRPIEYCSDNYLVPSMHDPHRPPAAHCMTNIRLIFQLGWWFKLFANRK